MPVLQLLGDSLTQCSYWCWRHLTLVSGVSDSADEQAQQEWRTRAFGRVHAYLSARMGSAM